MVLLERKAILHSVPVFPFPLCMHVYIFPVQSGLSIGDLDDKLVPVAQSLLLRDLTQSLFSDRTGSLLVTPSDVYSSLSQYSEDISRRMLEVHYPTLGVKDVSSHPRKDSGRLESIEESIPDTLLEYIRSNSTSDRSADLKR